MVLCFPQVEVSVLAIDSLGCRAICRGNMGLEQGWGRSSSTETRLVMLLRGFLCKEENTSPGSPQDELGGRSSLLNRRQDY